MGRPWFKHYNNASSGASLRSLWDNGDYEAYGLFWRLLELLCQFEDKDRPGSMTISWALLARETGWKPTKCRRVLSRICLISKIDMEEIREGYVTFLLPKWLELQSSWGGKREARFEQDAGRLKKLDLRLKNKREDKASGDLSAPADPPIKSKLVDLWNRERGPLPGVKILSTQRERKAKLAWGRHPSEEFWVQVIARIRESAFCTGTNDRGWVADFDFLLRPDTPARVLEGKYDNRGAGPGIDWGKLREELGAE